jgi:hypothetical protein
MGDILEKLEKVLEEDEALSQGRKYIPKTSVMEILECIKSEVKEDNFLLDIVIENVDKYWNISNKKLINSFYRILEGYGVIGESDERKTFLEQKGKTIIRKFVNLRSKERIKKML